MYENGFRALPLNPRFSIANFAKMSMGLLQKVFRPNVLARFLNDLPSMGRVKRNIKKLSA